MPNFQDIFHWEEWEDLDNFELYMLCTALRDVGDDIRQGDEFQEVYFDTNKLELYFYKEGDPDNPITKKFVLLA